MALRKNNRRGKKEDREFDQVLLDVARVTRVMKGGRRFSFRVTVVIGDRKGKVGLGVAKGADVTLAVGKAVYQAKKKMIKVPLIKGTIPHEIFIKKGSAKVFLKPGKKGSGIIAGGTVRTVCSLAGIKDIVGKIYGTSNKLNNAQATLEALTRLRVGNDILEKRAVVSKAKVVEKKEDSKEVKKSLKDKKDKK